MVKGGLILDSGMGTWMYQLTWAANPADEQVTGYKVYRVSPDANGALNGVSASNAAWTLIATVTDPSYLFTPGDITGIVTSNAGSWKEFRVVPTNVVGDGPSSNFVVVSDGFRLGRGSWLACAVVTTGLVRVAVQIPDTWNLSGPYSWQLTNSGGTLLASGTAPNSGVLSADVPTGTVLGNVKVTTGSSTVYSFTGSGTGTANYANLFNSVDGSGNPNKRC